MSAESPPGSSERARSRSGSGVCFERETEEGSERVRLSNEVDAGHPYLDSITATEPDARTYADPIPELPVPGSGERLPDCGDDVRPVFCNSCGHPPIVSRTCRRSRCPRCWQSWDFQRSAVAAAKVEAIRRYRAASGTKAKYHHLTVSFPDSVRFNSKDALTRAFAAVKLLLGEVGVYDGWLVYHPWRIAKPYRGDVRGHESGDGDMAWKDVLAKVESDEWTWEAAREEFLTYAPHFHVFANAAYVQGGAVSEHVESESGVVIHRVTKSDESAVSLYDLSDLCAALAYSYSHAGLTRSEDGSYRVAARGFGETANFDPTPNIEHEVDRELREVAADVLGVNFPKPECERETVDSGTVPGSEDSEDLPLSVRALTDTDGRDTPAGGAPAASVAMSSPGSGGFDSGGSDGFGLGGSSAGQTRSEDGGTATTWEATAGVSPDYLDEPTEDMTSRCGGSLVPMWAAEEYLSDSAWVESIGREAADELRGAREEWERRGEPEPVAPPPPD